MDQRPDRQSQRFPWMLLHVHAQCSIPSSLLTVCVLAWDLQSKEKQKRKLSSPDQNGSRMLTLGSNALP